MIKFEGYMAGVNFSGYECYGDMNPLPREAYSRFTEFDFKQVASWGCDHIRLPFVAQNFADYRRDNPVVEYALDAYDNVVYWCKKHGLNVVLDMHNAPGFFSNIGDNDLFENREKQLQFIDAWRILAKRYRNEGSNVSFDLLNEVIIDGGLPSGTAKWNRLWREVAAAIHEESPQRKIIVGGNYYNCINIIEDLDILDDERIQYNFHSYFPMIFTHQRYDNPKYLKQVEWPFDSMDHAEFFGGPDKIWPDHKGVVCIDHIYEEFKPIAGFTEKYGKPLYCGEYGVCEFAGMESKIRWLKDFRTVLRDYGIGRCVWAYIGFSSLVDPVTRKPFNDELIKVIASE